MHKSRRVLVVAFVAGLMTATAAFAAMQQATEPHLNAALKSLQDAQTHLTASKATGMHTSAAMTATKSAIEHTKEAISANEEK